MTTKRMHLLTMWELTNNNFVGNIYKYTYGYEDGKLVQKCERNSQSWAHNDNKDEDKNDKDNDIWEKGGKLGTNVGIMWKKEKIEHSTYLGCVIAKRWTAECRMQQEQWERWRKHVQLRN